MVLGMIYRVTGRTTDDTCEAVFDEADEHLDEIEDFLEGVIDEEPEPFDKTRFDVCETEDELDIIKERAVDIFFT